MILHVLLVDGSGALLEVGVVALLGVTVMLLVRLAQIDATWPEWPEQIRTLLVRLGALFLYLFVTLLSGTLSLAGELWGLLPQFINPLYVLVSIPVLLAILTFGLVLVAPDQQKNPRLRAAAFFVLLVPASTWRAYQSS